MKKTATAALVAVTTLVACGDPNTTNQVGTGVAGGAIAAIAANALGASEGWTIAAGVAGATAGALYARNRAADPDQCAYHTGDGSTVTVGECR